MAWCAHAEEKTAVPDPIAYLAIGIIIGAVLAVRGLDRWERNRRSPAQLPLADDTKQLKP